MRAGVGVRLQKTLIALVLAGGHCDLTTIKAPVHYEEVIGKSRFIAFAGCAQRAAFAVGMNSRQKHEQLCGSENVEAGSGCIN